MFMTPDKRVLFLQRSGEGDHAGEWCLPGGKIESDETPEEAARREANEEIGKHPSGELALLTRTRRVEVAVPAATAPASADGPPLVPDAGALEDTVVSFTTFVQMVKEPFDVKLDKEHTAFAWVPTSAPPQPLHPGVAVTVARLTMNELDLAEAIREAA